MKIRATNKKMLSWLLIFIMATVFGFGQVVHTARAAQLTSLKAVFKRIKASTNADGLTITFATPTGIQTGGGDTIIFTFSSDFTLAAEAANNFDILLGDSNNCATASYAEEVVALTASATDWGVDVTGNALTLSPETDQTLTAGFCMRVEMGTDATNGATGASDTVVNGAADDDDSIAITGAFADTGTIGIDIITDDQVAITATVNSSITFTISDNTIEFGTLSASAATWADDSGGSTTDVAAHTMTIATNAASGYAITYNGATLTSGGNNINVAAISNDANGTPGTEEFGLSISTDGNGTIATGYNHADPDWTWIAGTTTTIFSETVPTATETITARYIANILGTTEAGAYTTTATYIATGTY